MSDVTVWEQPAGRELLRLSIRDYKGHRFADLRRYYRSGDDDWKHSPKGCTIPLEHVGAVGAALTALASGDTLDGPENGTKTT